MRYARTCVGGGVCRDVRPGRGLCGSAAVSATERDGAPATVALAAACRLERRGGVVVRASEDVGYWSTGGIVLRRAVTCWSVGEEAAEAMVMAEADADGGRRTAGRCVGGSFGDETGRSGGAAAS